jgi:hypothetical protein
VANSRYDLIGCDYNMPGNYDSGSFTSCDGDLQDIVGRYVGPDGQSTFLLYLIYQRTN